MKKWRVLLCVLAFVFLFTVHLGASDPLTVAIPLPNGEIEEIVSSDGVFYLPAAVDVKHVALRFNDTISYTVGGETKSLAEGDVLDLTPALTVDARGVECYMLTVTYANKTQSLTFYHAGDIASVFIKTSKGISYIESGKNNRDKDAEITVLTADGALAYAEDGTKSEIKGRGNATFTYYKKPYQIKLGAKTSLLGMEKSKTWILLANYTDQSAVRNAMAFAFGEALEIPYNIDYRFADLYIDGVYRGLYMLTEKVQIDGSRVDIFDLEAANEDANEGRSGDEFSIVKQTSGDAIEHSILTYYTYASGMKSPEDITGGYIVELDINRGLSEPCHFVTENGNIYTVKAPEYASREEMEYIAVLFADLEEAIFSEDGYNRKGIHYSEYIDMESFAGIYTIQELMKNWDAYLSSMFFFKDADVNGERAKIYMGPLWDMDNTLGNINFNYEFGQDTAYLWAQNGVFQQLPRDYAKKLMMHEDFRLAVEASYDTAYLAAKEMLSESGWLDMTVATIRDSVMMDRTRWKLYDANAWLLNAAGYKSNVKFVQFKEYGTAQDHTKDTALGFLRYYLTERLDALLYLIGRGEVPTPPAPPETTETAISLTEEPELTSSQTEEATTTADEASGYPEEPMNCGGGYVDLFVGIAVAAFVVIAIAIVVVLSVISKKKKQ